MFHGLALLFILVTAMSVAFLFLTERAETPTSECSASSIGDPSHVPASIQVEDLGDNFVQALRVNNNVEFWTHYDLKFPYKSEPYCFVTGKLYWILVKEPQEVILGGQYRNLTCTSQGNCWNLIVW